MEEIEIDIDWFDAKAQPYILQAYRDPVQLKRPDLEYVAKVVVNRAWVDPAYYPRAARLCRTICQKESENLKYQMIPHYNFRNGVISACSDILQKRILRMQDNMFQWICFCHFIAETYKSILVQGATIGSIGRMLFELLNELCKEQNLQRFDQVELLHSILLECGRDLDKEDTCQMNEIFNFMREAFLGSETSSEIRAMLMQVIELRASSWKFSADAQEYYFGM